MKRSFLLISSVLMCLAFFSCKTVEIQDIPSDMTAAQLLQAGQTAELQKQYKNAEAYFKACIQRYGMDNNIYVEARYELGNCYLKENEKAKAETCFKEILSMYENTEYGYLSPSYQKLATIGMDKLKR